MEKYEIAVKYRALYNSGQCDRETAKEYIMPYVDFVNNRAKEIAKKYNRKAKNVITFASFVR